MPPYAYGDCKSLRTNCKFVGAMWQMLSRWGINPKNDCIIKFRMVGGKVNLSKAMKVTHIEPC